MIRVRVEYEFDKSEYIYEGINLMEVLSDVTSLSEDTLEEKIDHDDICFDGNNELVWEDEGMRFIVLS